MKNILGTTLFKKKLTAHNALLWHVNRWETTERVHIDHDEERSLNPAALMELRKLSVAEAYRPRSSQIFKDRLDERSFLLHSTRPAARRLVVKSSLIKKLYTRRQRG